MPKFVADLDMEKHQILNGVIHASGTEPTSPAPGQLWFDLNFSQLNVAKFIGDTDYDFFPLAYANHIHTVATHSDSPLSGASSWQILMGSSSLFMLLYTLTAGEGIDLAKAEYPTSTLTISAEDASESNKGIVELATSAETTSGLAVQASDTRLAQASTSNRGTVVLATGSEVDTGTDTDKAVTPKALADSKYVTEDGTLTLTNKRITSRSGSTASTATLTVDSDSYDVYCVTAQAEALSIANPSGTPTNGQKIILRIKDNGTARAITWSGSYWRAMGITLPTTTVISKTVYVGAIWNSTDSKWDVIALAQEA